MPESTLHAMFKVKLPMKWITTTVIDNMVLWLFYGIIFFYHDDDGDDADDADDDYMLLPV